MARNEYACETFMGEVRDMVEALVAQIAGTAMEQPTPGEGLQRAAMLRPEGALDCPKCLAEGRTEGFLSERAGTKGTFLVCSTGTGVCGFLTDKPKNARQRKALQEIRCPICTGAMRLCLPQEKGKPPWLSCCAYPDCQGVRWFDGKGTMEKAQSIPETGPPCPTCGTSTVQRGPTKAGHTFWSCPRWRRDGLGCQSTPIWINAPGP